MNMDEMLQRPLVGFEVPKLEKGGTNGIFLLILLHFSKSQHGRSMFVSGHVLTLIIVGVLMLWGLNATILLMK